MSEIDDLRAAAVADPEVPEVVRRFLGGGATLDALRLDSRGRWTFNGAPVEHPRVQHLFSRSLRLTRAGTWILEIAPYTYPVLVQATGRFVRRIRTGERSGGASPIAELTSGATTSLDLTTLETDGDSYLGVLVADERARLIEAAYQDIAAGLDADDAGWLVEFGGATYRVAIISADDPLRARLRPGPVD